jgi:DsbC/DsbD-like thiol-disulfide interchange protein
MLSVMPSSRDFPLVASVLAVALLAQAPARAESASQWDVDIRAASRLIAATAKAGAAHYRVGVELRMDPGWHTYWRYPGDSGVAPTFDFGDSDNVRSAKVLYPAPQAITDDSGTIIGYTDHVIFPVVITPRDSAKPVRLKLDLQYAVCQKICVPSQGHHDLTLDSKPSDFDQDIAGAMASVPKEVTPQQAGLTIRRINKDPKPLVAVDIATKDDVQIFAEGPTAEWALPIPKPVEGAQPGHRQFGFALDGLPPGADPKKPVDLTFTIVDGNHAIQTTAHLD